MRQETPFGRRRIPRRRVLATAILVASITSATATAAPAEYADVVLADGPTLYYRLSETSGNAENLGSLGSDFDGVYNGSALRGAATSSGDAGVQFTAASDFIESLTAAPAEYTGNPDFTAETLINHTELPTSWVEQQTLLGFC